MFEKQHKYTVR